MSRPRLPLAIVFDMDGLLLDSERVALETFVAACREHGFEPDVDIYYRCIGSQAPNGSEILRQGYGPEFPLEAVEASWSASYRDRVENHPVPIKPGALELLERCRQLGIPCALATSTRRPLVDVKLGYWALGEYFETFVTGDRVERGKPHPEPYLTAATELDRRPADCWALEDSETGVRSAHAAGFDVYQVPDLVTPSDAVRALGHTIVDSLHDVVRLLEGA